jgi:glycosyltransferase involved in cell wall biosynthesis
MMARRATRTKSSRKAVKAVPKKAQARKAPARKAAALAKKTDETVVFDRRRKAEPLISIVIPTLQEGKYAEECFSSIQKQAMRKDAEIIIVDGGSTDATLAISKKYADLILHEPVRNIAVARNTGMFRARGKIIICANADTVYPEGWLGKLTAQMRADPKVAATIGKILPKDGDAFDKAFAEHVLHHFSKAACNFNHLHYVDSSNLAVSAKHFQQIGGFNGSLVCGDDTDLVRRLAKVGKVTYSGEGHALISMRRVKKWGKVKFFLVHASSFVRTHMNMKGHMNYEPVRE